MKSKTISSDKETRRKKSVTPTRPRIPAAYGVPKSTKGLLPWSHVQQRMSESRAYWVCTVSPDGRPHATPVDGLWLDDELYFGGDPSTKRNRNLAANPALCVHLESGFDVVILHGDVQERKGIDRALAEQLADASMKKYGYAPRPEDYQSGGVQVVRPRVVFAWKAFPKDVTRWEFPATQSI